ncbi:MAG: hypothetical protein HYV63_19640 [Candidatus Schekmanbacteria bacterium]|nr:hypothetical protein [Candidatus Schekmanbacteria bacterium]
MTSRRAACLLSIAAISLTACTANDSPRWPLAVANTPAAAGRAPVPLPAGADTAVANPFSVDHETSADRALQAQLASQLYLQQLAAQQLAAQQLVAAYASAYGSAAPQEIAVDNGPLGNTVYGDGTWSRGLTSSYGGTDDSGGYVCVDGTCATYGW